MTPTDALAALKALEQGVWDDPALMSIGPIHPNNAVNRETIHRMFLAACGFTVGTRDPRVNTDYPGQYMAIEDYAGAELPCANGGESGSWAIVGDDERKLIADAFEYAIDVYGQGEEDEVKYGSVPAVPA